MMADKRGKISTTRRAWIRILESAIAVMLLIGFFTVISMKHVSLPDVSDEVYQLERTLLKEVSESDSIRQAVLNNNAELVYEFTAERLSPTISLAVRICDPAEDCTFPVAGTLNSYPANLQKPEQNIYTDDYLISSSLEAINPRLVKIFVWFDPREITQDDFEMQPPCGDNVVYLETEQCDGSDMPLMQCSELNLGTGALSCNLDCTYNTQGCSQVPVITLCSDAGGACKPSDCGAYNTCSSLTGKCDTGYCCAGACTEPVVVPGKCIYLEAEYAIEATINPYDESAYPNTLNKGICKAGEWKCADAGNGKAEWNKISNPVYPSADVCDGKDNNCDGQTDENVMVTFYLDGDIDAYGNALSTKQACTKPAGHVLDKTDCDDTRKYVNPGVVEGEAYGNCADELDNDCDGDMDDADSGCGGF